MDNLFVKLVVLSSILIVLDAIVLNALRPLFMNQILIVQKSPLQLDMVAAVACYIVILFVLYYFIIMEKRNIKDTFFLGFSIYSIFELTNKSLLQNWKWETVAIDSVWGGVLFASTTFLYRKAMYALRNMSAI